MELTTKQKMRIARFVAKIVQSVRKLLLRPKKALVKRNGIYWDLDLWEAIDLSIYLTGRFEKATQKSMLRGLSDDAVVIDIGAQIMLNWKPRFIQVGHYLVMGITCTEVFCTLLRVRMLSL
jgi:hypothetical protein